MSHPLENEELIVTVSVIHVLTAKEAVAQLPAGTFNGGTLDIEKAIEDAGKVALHRLLEQLEISGGG